MIDPSAIPGDKQLVMVETGQAEFVEAY